MGRLGLVSAAVRCLGLGLSLGLIAGACGDDDDAAGSGATGEGCITDVECKGDRICVDHECVNPDGADDRDRDGGASGTGGTGGSRPSGTAGSGRDGGTAGTRAGNGGSGGSGVIDDPELERACGLNCEARAEASCEMNVGSLDQCLAQCLIADEALRGYCLEEQTAHFACQASGGYTCVSGYPQPKSTCSNEALALGKCGAMRPCREYCAITAGACAPEGEDECLESCLGEQSGFAVSGCGAYYPQLLSCWGQKLTCANGKPVIGECQSQAAQIADCIGGRAHECDGFCWAADALGCGSDDCVTTCKAKADEARCGSYYGRLVECTYRSRTLALTCEGGTPTPNATTYSSEIQQYESCVLQM